MSLLSRLSVRWLITSLGLWVAAGILGDERLSTGHRLSAVLWAGLILAVVNIFLKPLLIFLSLPALLLTLGLFMIVVNGLLILIVSNLYSPLYVKNLGWAMVAGLIIGLVNYLVTRILETDKHK